MTSTSYIHGTGIGVSDIAVSTDFYTNAVGLSELRTHKNEEIHEVVLGFVDQPGVSVLLLMHWPRDTSRRYDGTDVKIVIRVEDTAKVINKIRGLGAQIVREPTFINALGGIVMGMARDPDGYLVEFISSAEGAEHA